MVINTTEGTTTYPETSLNGFHRLINQPTSKQKIATDFYRSAKYIR